MVESKFLTNVHLAPWPTALEFLPPWATALGEPPTVGSLHRWGQAPAAVAIGGRIPSAAAHGGRALAPWPTTAEPAYIRGRALAGGPSLLPHSFLQTFGFQPLRSASDVCF
jgi:hypothetical protein